MPGSESDHSPTSFHPSASIDCLGPRSPSSDSLRYLLLARTDDKIDLQVQLEIEISRYGKPRIGGLVVLDSGTYSLSVALIRCGPRRASGIPLAPSTMAPDPE